MTSTQVGHVQYLLPVGPTAARSSPSTLGSMRAISRTETTATGHVSSTHRHARRLGMQDEPLASRGMASCQEKTWPWPPPCTSTAIRSQMGWFGAPTLCVDECITYRLCNHSILSLEEPLGGNGSMILGKAQLTKAQLTRNTMLKSSIIQFFNSMDSREKPIGTLPLSS